MTPTRRELIKALGALATTQVLSACGGGATEDADAAAQAALPPPGSGDADAVFPQTLASGDPTPSGAVIWTRIAADAVTSQTPMHYQVATDTGFASPVLTGTVATAELRSERDYTVKVDLDGRLDPDRFYFYRFTYGRSSSRVGRLRTLPAAGAPLERLKLALVGCQDFLLGYFNAYALIAATDDLDYVLHMGDFIYESAGDSVLPGRSITLPSGNSSAITLADYRTIYRAHRSDADFRAALERHTLLLIWDDHEIANDRYFDGEHPRGPDHPNNGDPEAHTRTHLAGVQAWWEYCPIRVPYEPAKGFPDLIEPERGFRFGDLAALYLTDERLHKSPHPCGEGFAGERYIVPEATCTARLDEGRTMLGNPQRAWLLDALENAGTQWRIWGSPIPLSPLNTSPATLLQVDAWDGYVAERSRVLAEVNARGIENFGILTGDLHAFLVATLYDGYDSLDSPVGFELAAASLSSIPLSTLFGPLTTQAGMLANNPHLQYWNSDVNGYCEVVFTSEECRMRLFQVTANLDTGGQTPRAVVAEYRVPAGGRIPEPVAVSPLA